jgi:hypothetical protein
MHIDKSFQNASIGENHFRGLVRSSSSDGAPGGRWTRSKPWLRGEKCGPPRKNEIQ